MDIASDAPPGSGLGGSTALVTACVGALVAARGPPVHRRGGGERSPTRSSARTSAIAGGWQDQYAAAFGGFNLLEFEAEGVTVRPLELSEERLATLRSYLLLCYSGTVRTDLGLIDTQIRLFEQGREETIVGMKQLHEMAYEMRDAIVAGELDALGAMLREAYESKKRMNPHIADGTPIERLLALAHDAGATGRQDLRRRRRRLPAARVPARAARARAPGARGARWRSSRTSRSGRTGSRPVRATACGGPRDAPLRPARSRRDDQRGGRVRAAPRRAAAAPRRRRGAARAPGSRARSRRRDEPDAGRPRGDLAGGARRDPRAPARAPGPRRRVAGRHRGVPPSPGRGMRLPQACDGPGRPRRGGARLRPGRGLDRRRSPRRHGSGPGGRRANDPRAHRPRRGGARGRGRGRSPITWWPTCPRPRR